MGRDSCRAAAWILHPGGQSIVPAQRSNGVSVLVQLIGGGRRPEAGPRMYGPFLDAAGATPDVACVMVDEGDGIEQFGRWRDALVSVARCRPAPVLVPRGSPLALADLDGADGLLVCGGLTPAYAGALAPVAEQVRAWLAAGNRPYAGFSAGAAVGAAAAVVGGWLQDGTPVCPEDAAEDLEELTVTAGLGLVPFAVDVHCSSWGTLPRLVAAVRARQVPWGVALDEDTALTVRDGHARTVGLGRAYVVHVDSARLRLDVLADGDVLPLPPGD
jgi:cyanophycinase